jgi:hypothetical protein
MTPRVHDGAAMIGGMSPVLTEGRFVFATGADPALLSHAVATCREDEGLSLILPEDIARAAEMVCSAPMRRITLEVHSSLEGVGLTAAVATALAEAGIACNMVAGNHHDHAFVPADRAEEALQVLKDLSAG